MEKTRGGRNNGREMETAGRWEEFGSGEKTLGDYVKAVGSREGRRNEGWRDGEC